MRQTLRRAVFLAAWLSFGCTSRGDDSEETLACPDGYVGCAGVCTDPKGDGENCGGCGTSCGVDQVCSDGVCRQSCVDPGRTECASSCVDLQTHPGHCGGCDIECGAGRICQSGVCGGGSDTGGTGSTTGVGTGGGASFSTEVLIEEGDLGQCEVAGVVESKHDGFSGTGYLNTDNTAGASIEWAVEIGEAGTYSLEFAYANESGDRPADVLIGTAVAASGVPFGSTSSWTSWSTATVDVTLAAGENRIILSATSAAGLPNIDNMAISGAAVSPADCDGMVGTGGGTSGSTGGTGGTEEVPPCESNELAAWCEGSNEIACHFGGEPGDYRVTVELGGDAAGDMVVDAEMHRRMLGETSTTAGENRRFAFVVNVRAYEGQPLDPDQKGSSTGISGLDVYVRGAAPQLTAICRELIEPEPKVWLAGDSTVCDQSGTDFSGWGQHLPQFFDGSVSVANYADSGESSGSFLGGAKLWQTITAGWKSGDWVLIQLGHNDKDVTGETFEANLRAMVDQAKAVGVRPVLITPISRAGTALESQHVNSTGANLPQIIRDLGAEESVPVLDLTVITWEWLQTIDWTSYFALGTDKTHPNPRGAGVIAGFVADAIRDQEIDLAEHLR